MKRDYLLFQLYGPMTSWGDIAVGEIRPSYNRPSRSAILGLIAAALGIRRNEEEAHQALANDLGIAIEVRKNGSLLSDYHTIQRPPQRAKVNYPTRRAELTTLAPDQLATTVSTRDYYTDAFYVIAVWQRKESTLTYSLKTIEERLIQPEFVLYLGRKSCPLALPLDPKIVENSGSVLHAFEKRWKDDEVYKQYAWSNVLRIGNEKLRDSFNYYSDEKFDESECIEMIIRRDEPVSRLRWQFNDREEFRLLGREQYGLSESN